MSSMAYIILKSIKNWFKELLRKPGKLVMYLAMIALIVGVVLISSMTDQEMQDKASQFWFTGILLVFISLFVVISVAKGLSNGDNIFEMNDVNLLFVSPVNSRSILLYGILRLAKVAFLAGFFIFYQANTLAMFGIRFSGVLLTFGAFVLCVMVLSIVSLVIYSTCNGNSRRKAIVRGLTVLLYVPLIAFLLLQFFGGQDILTALESAIKSPYAAYIPIAGWTAAGVTCILSGEVLRGLLFLGANVVLGSALIAYVMRSNPDYYEDVLVATETVFEKKRAMAEGNINAARQSSRHITVIKTGISGMGARALFGKHLRESFRQNRFGFLTITSAIMVAVAIAMQYFFKDTFMVIQMLLWAQIFLIGTGRGLQETYTHYIYMIPETSFSKMVWSNMEILLRSLIEAVLIFVIGGVLANEGLPMILTSIVLYTLFSFLILGINYVSMRFTGADMSSGLLMMLYMISVIVVLAPGLVAALIVGFNIGGTVGIITGMLILSAWELVAGLICFALCKSVLHNCDMPVVKAKA